MLGSSLHSSAKMREVGDTQPDFPFLPSTAMPGISQSSWGLTTSKNQKKPNRSGESSSTTSTLSTTLKRWKMTSCCSRQGVLWGTGWAEAGRDWAGFVLALSAKLFLQRCWRLAGLGGTWEGSMGFGGFDSSSLELAEPARPCVLLTALSQPPAFPQLTSKAIYNDYVQPIPLPKTGSDLPTGTKCVIAGWGLIDEDRATNKLFETKVSIYSRRKCILFYPHLDSGMICAGSFHELKDSSQVWGGHTGLSGSRSCCWQGHSQLPGQVTRSQFP